VIAIEFIKNELKHLDSFAWQGVFKKCGTCLVIAESFQILAATFPRVLRLLALAILARLGLLLR